MDLWLLAWLEHYKCFICPKAEKVSNQNHFFVSLVGLGSWNVCYKQ